MSHVKGGQILYGIISTFNQALSISFVRSGYLKIACVPKSQFSQPTNELSFEAETFNAFLFCSDRRVEDWNWTNKSLVVNNVQGDYDGNSVVFQWQEDLT